MIGHLIDLVTGRNGRQRVTIELNGDFAETFDSLKDKVVSVDVKQYRERRSLDANAYCWVLVDKIAHERGLPKAEVYRQAIRDIGGVSDTLCMRTKAVDQFRRIWERNGLGYQTDIMASKIPGCTNVIAYYGSSVYDTKQMSALIDALVQDAQALGIETRTPEQLEQMKTDWREYSA